MIFFSLASIIKVISSRQLGWLGHMVCVGKNKCLQDFGGQSQGERPLGRPRHR